MLNFLICFLFKEKNIMFSIFIIDSIIYKSIKILNFQYNESSPCRDFTKGATMLYRTHPFLLEYEYNVYTPADVALITQCSVERIPLLEDLSKHWPGTISVALYLTDAEVQNFLEFVRGSIELRNRKNIAYHVVYKDGVCLTRIFYVLYTYYKVYSLVMYN